MLLLLVVLLLVVVMVVVLLSLLLSLPWFKFSLLARVSRQTSLQTVVRTPGLRSRHPFRQPCNVSCIAMLWRKRISLARGNAREIAAGVIERRGKKGSPARPGSKRTCYIAPNEL